MPVYYYIQADLPDHIQEVTLSYTFYRNDNDDALAQAIASSSSQN
jgi:cytochrome c oxidase assembly protein Cox11